MSRRSWALFATMCVVWGVPYLLIRVAVRDLSPAALVFARTAIGALVLLPVAVHGRGFRVAFRPVLRRWRALVAFSAIEIAVPWLLLSDAETKLSSSLTGLLVAAVPLVGVVIVGVGARTGSGLGGSADPVDARRLGGLLLGFAGVAGLVGLDFADLQVGRLAEVLVVVIGYAVGPMIMARSLADLPRVPVVTAALSLTALAYLPAAVIQRPERLDSEVVLSVLGLGVVCTAMAFVLFFALVAAIGPARSTVITYVNPAVAVLLGIAFLGEDLTAGMLVGFPLILAGSVLAAGRATRVDPAAVDRVEAQPPAVS